MVNKSTNINKASTHPLTSTHGANNIKMAYDVGNPGSAWDRHNNVVGLNVLKGSQLCPS